MKLTYFLAFICSSIVSVAAFGQEKDTLQIGYYESPPFVMETDEGRLSGVSIWLWEQIQKDIEHPFKLIPYDTDKPLSDLLRDLETGRIDMAINPLTITSSRDSKLDFTYPIYIADLTIVQSADSSSSSFIKVVREFLNHKVLLLILVLAGLVIFFGLILWLVEKKNHHFEPGIKGLFSSFWWSAVTMTTVGYGDKVPISHLGRFIAFIWMLCSIIIIAIFSASITSSLTVHRLTNANLSVQSFKQAKLGTVNSSASEEFLKRNFFRNFKTYPELNTGLRALQTGEVDYFLYDEPWLIYLLNNELEFSTLELMPVRFNRQLYAFPMREDMSRSFEKKVSSSIIRLMETKDWEILLGEFGLSPN